MKAAFLTGFRRPLELRDLPIPEPGSGQVRIRVHASGVCGTDLHVWRGQGGVSPPAVLGHEPVGEVEQLGAGVTNVRVGDRVGVSWTQRGCGRCRYCQEERPKYCADPVTWVENGGGNAEFMLAEAAGCTLLPEQLSWEEAAPLFCAGFTVMSGYRNAGPRPGDRIGILGMGGLGHLGLQIAKAYGHGTVAITNSPDKVAALRSLGADEVLVIKSHVGKELRQLGGVDVILSTSNSMSQNGEALRGLLPEGRFVTMAVSEEPIAVIPNLMLGRQLVLKGSMLNDRKDLIEVLQLAAQGKVRPQVEVYPLEEINIALERLEQGRVRYRAVLRCGEDR